MMNEEGVRGKEESMKQLLRSQLITKKVQIIIYIIQQET
jgi:hypothetical protein